ncbi:MAG: TonB-dependent receptor [Bacteroidota bacterium]|nr:TonB-dependent receptor [Bacteroidota bacterium]MDP4259761.1 TonB-dependent receptor [Bacteroidota bacterium]
MAFPQNSPLSKALRISGYVKDSATGNSLEKATLILRQAGVSPDRKVISDKSGYFLFNDLQPAKYELYVDFVGYRSFAGSYLLNAANTPSAQTIYLVPAVTVLQNATVTARKPLVEYGMDKIVYNVDRDITSQGGTAIDVLRKVPQVSVDVNGNVELLGNPSVGFLINGKISAMFGSTISDALQSIPASQIQSIEVLSSPGASYDANGTGGVINIILKQNKARGFSGIINATGGTRAENGSLNLNYKIDNLSFNAYFNGSSQLKVNTLSELTRNAVDTATGNQYRLHQQGNSDFTRNSSRSGVGMDWDITLKDNISLSMAYSHFGNSNMGYSDQYDSEQDKYGTTLDELTSRRFSNTLFNNGNLDVNADYKRKFGKDKQELTFSFLYSASDNTTGYRQSQQYVGNDSLFSGSTSNNPGKDHVNSFAISYSTPVAKNITLEAGAKMEMEELLSNANVFTFSPQVYDYVFDTQQSYSSTFKRKVVAGYFSGTCRLFNRFDLIGGLRWEHTANNAWYSNSGKADIPDYSNLAPSLIVSHTFPNQQIIRFAYSYRLERPDFKDLNPFVNLSDPHNIVTGNPEIRPEIGRNYQLSYNLDLPNDNSLNIMLLYTHNSPDIKSYTTFYPQYVVGDSTYSNVNVVQRGNIAGEQRYGLNLSGSFVIGKLLTLRPTIQLYDRQVNNVYAIPQRSGGFESRGNMNVNYQVSKTLVAEVFGNYRSGIKWQGRQAGFYSYSLALRQQILNGNGSIGLVAVNAFGEYLTQRTTQEAVGLNAATVLRIPYRSFGLNLMYKFGKRKIKAREAENLLAAPPVDNQ